MNRTSINGRATDGLLLRRASELLGMLAVGDGLIATVAPKRHVELWRGGPEPWDRTVDFFSRHPMLGRAVGLAAIGAGLWLMLRQLEPERNERD